MWPVDLEWSGVVIAGYHVNLNLELNSGGFSIILRYSQIIVQIY